MTYRDITYKGSVYRIRGLTADSRLVKPYMAFMAVRGTALDGTQFIADAISRGASLIITHADMVDNPPVLPDLVQILYVGNPRRVYAYFCHLFYAPKPNTIMAVTGTNGKTSVANFTMQLLQKIGQKSIAVGTMGVHGAMQDTNTHLTTPEPSVLHRILYQAHVEYGADYACLEASSHGLDMCRLDGLSVQAGAFTNLSHDHLDYHRDMPAYFNAKLRLFSHVIARGGVAVLNASTKYFYQIQQVCFDRGIRVVSYGVVGENMAVVPDIYAYSIRPTVTGFYVHMSVMNQSVCIHIPLIGKFQLENVLCALGLSLQSGIAVGQIIPHLADISPIAGRMEYVAKTPSGGVVYVDYAHTPEALKIVLQALRLHTKGRLLVVFGCGGNRDANKRPVMGKIAFAYADKAFVTDDNPRHEDPQKIRTEILQGGECIDAGNRVQAIHMALGSVQQDDILVIAGKGHETGQIIGDTVQPHNDADSIRNFIRDM